LSQNYNFFLILQMHFENDLILRTLNAEQLNRKPVWLMRQAGRVLPEYRATRKKAKNFIAMVKNPELVTEVTLQPVEILGVDAAIIFSDILVIPEAMGLPYTMEENKGPAFPATIQNQSDIDNLKIADGTHDLNYVIESIQLTVKELNGKVPLIGFAGAPWTILAYMVEGSGSKTFSKAKAFLYQEPEMAHQLLEKITLSTISYLKAQQKAGVSILQIFDSWASILSPAQYRTFALKYIHQIADAVKDIPLIVFAKGAAITLEELSKINCAALSLDWTIEPHHARSVIGADRVLQGNLDPCVLYAENDIIKKETTDMLTQFGKNHIVNLGHGLYPDIQVDKVKYFIEMVRTFQF